MTIEIELAGGGDERVDPNRIFYIRDPRDFELNDEPSAKSVLSIPSATLLRATARDALAQLFSVEVALARLATPDGSPIYVRCDAVVDVDHPIWTNPPGTGSWLVFGTGPRARRLAVRPNRSALGEVWRGLELAPGDHGI